MAFTDPNVLLSYRLTPSRYKDENVKIVDILVSNDKTNFGLLERPDTAHRAYSENTAVTGFIACGWPRSPAQVSLKKRRRCRRWQRRVAYSG